MRAVPKQDWKYFSSDALSVLCAVEDTVSKILSPSHKKQAKAYLFYFYYLDWNHVLVFGQAQLWVKVTPEAPAQYR